MALVSPDEKGSLAKQSFDDKFHFKIIFTTHLFARFEREPLFGTFSHNSLDIFQCITPASKSRCDLIESVLYKTVIVPFMFEHLLDR